MDPIISASLISVTGLVLSAVAGHTSGRRARDAQADDLETQVAERVVRLQEVERLKLTRRIEELEAEVKDLRTMTAQREQELMRDLESVRGERDTLRAELAGVRTQLVAKEAELVAARQEIANLHAVALVQATPGTSPAS